MQTRARPSPHAWGSTGREPRKHGLALPGLHSQSTQRGGDTGIPPLVTRAHARTSHLTPHQAKPRWAHFMGGHPMRSPEVMEPEGPGPRVLQDRTRYY